MKNGGSFWTSLVRLGSASSLVPTRYFPLSGKSRIKTINLFSLFAHLDAVVFLVGVPSYSI